MSLAMNLSTAQSFAVKIGDWLMPHCEHISIAGSIRRRRPVCNDVDLVCIPKITVDKDMLGEVTGRVNHALKFLQTYVAESGGKASFISGGEREGKQVMVQLPKCQLDLWFATKETLSTRLLCRTGSMEHNVWLAGRAKSRGDHWNPYEGLFTGGRYERDGEREIYVGGKLIETEIEEDIYRALDVPFIDPINREMDWIRRNVK